MLLKIFAIRDARAEAYMQPFFVQSRGVAMRDFSDVVNQSGHAFNKHPSDFALFELGEFDDNSAQFENHPQPILVAAAVDVLLVAA